MRTNQDETAGTHAGTGRFEYGQMLGEYAYAARSHEQPDDDEDDSPEQLPTEQGEDPGHDQDHGEYPEKKFHDHWLPFAAALKHARPEA